MNQTITYSSFLKELGEKGIQPDADQTKKFLEDGTLPT